jgi:hypothetical protein
VWCTTILHFFILYVKIQLSEKSLDETEVERDFSIRRKVKALFNKKERDFKTVDEFKDYEERVEDIIYNLVNLINVDETNKLIDVYKQENSKEIIQNQFKVNEETKNELILIKEKEDALAFANFKFQVRIVSFMLLTLVSLFYAIQLFRLFCVWCCRRDLSNNLH